MLTMAGARTIMLVMASPGVREREPAAGGGGRNGLNQAAFWAGVSAFLFFVFGALTVQLSVLREFGISESQQASWISITWLSCALVTIPLCLYYRQPLAIGWTLPGLVYMGSLSDRFTLGEMATANLVVGVLIAVIGLAGLASRIINLVPMPILMAMFAASIVQYITRLVESTVDKAYIGGPMVAAYLAGRLINNKRVPPVGLAVVAGIVMVAVTGKFGSFELTQRLPKLEFVDFSVSPEALLSISIPMLVLVLGLGNIQSLGFMISEGYRPPLNAVTAMLGLTTIANAIFGGHPAAMARTGTAMVAGRDAGPFEARYWAAIVAFVPAIGVAVATGPAMALIAVLPGSFIAAMAGLAIFGAFQDALERSFTGNLRFGCAVAFAVTLSDFSIAAVPSAFWALIAGIGASLLLERRELLHFWKQVMSTPHSPMDHVVESMDIRRWEAETPEPATW